LIPIWIYGVVEIQFPDDVAEQDEKESTLKFSEKRIWTKYMILTNAK
jgi:hypothetical protein